MKSKKAILVAGFGCLVDYDIEQSELGLAKFLNLTHAELLWVLDRSSGEDFACGKIPASEFLRRLNDELLPFHWKRKNVPVHTSVEELILLWTATYKISPQEVESCLELSAETGLPVWLADDLNDLDRSWLNVQGLLATFGGRLVSSLDAARHDPGIRSRAQCRKLEPAFIERAKQVIGESLGETVSLSDLVLLDANLDIVERANNIGLDAILFNGESSWNELRLKLVH